MIQVSRTNKAVRKPKEHRGCTR